MSDADRARTYGAGQPGFGGVFYDGDQLVVLFTEKLDEHQEALCRIADRPDLLEVRAASRTLDDVQIARAQVTDRLLGPDGPGGVNAVGIGVRDGQFVVEVGIDPYDETQAGRVHAAAAPDDVHVHHQPRPRLF